MDVTRTVVYQGPAPYAGMLAQMLREQGVQVKYTPPEERRGLAGDLNEVIVNLISTGSAAAIGLAIKKFLERKPRAKVNVEDDDSHGGPRNEGSHGRAD
jgi:hypothetical protein